MSSLPSRALRRARRDERGQAFVEFALLAPLFLMLVVGVIQFAVALNFWFDMQRLANQGARAAAVNCGENSATGTGNLCETTRTSPGTKNLEQSLLDQIQSRGNDSTAEVCYVPADTSATPTQPATAGNAVRVTLKNRYRLQMVVRLAKIDLTARTIMRLEQEPTVAAGLPDPSISPPTNYVLTTHTGTDRCQP